MLGEKQLSILARNLNTNQTTVMREYLQLVFLSTLYNYKIAQKIFFKGGTAIRLILNGDRFILFYLLRMFFTHLKTKF